jgi:hypothetical protein
VGGLRVCEEIRGFRHIECKCLAGACSLVAQEDAAGLLAAPGVRRNLSEESKARFLHVMLSLAGTPLQVPSTCIACWKMHLTIACVVPMGTVCPFTLEKWNPHPMFFFKHPLIIALSTVHCV